MQNLEYNLQLNDYLKKYHLKEYKTKKMVKYSVFKNYVYKQDNIEAMIKSTILFYSTNIFIKNCNIDTNNKSLKIFYFNSSFIKIKQNKDIFILSILVDTVYDIRIELNLNSLKDIEKFIISNFLKDSNFENYNINFAINNSLDFDYSLYSIIKFYK
jgi:hypothetical protein